jgi:hypothetical protein
MILGVTALAGKTSRARQTAYYSLSGYIAATTGRFCSGLTSAVTVYTAVSETSFATAYSNNRVIYADTALTTQADSGVYAVTAGGSSGQTSYIWTKGTGWEGDNVCG